MKRFFKMLMISTALFYTICGMLWAGALNPTAPPSDTGSAMYTLEDLYNRLDTGAAGTKRTGNFTEPTNPAASTGYSLDEIMAKMPAADNANGAAPGDVLLGKTFFALNTEGVWGPTTGTLVEPIEPTEGNILEVRTQEDFDAIFNQGPSTAIATNSTILLYPLKDSTPYLLKNTVTIHSGVSIVGFNPQATRVIKESAFCRFELIGSAPTPVTGVQFTGWTFDGNKLVANNNGGAIYLQYAKDCKFNCHLINHFTTGNGGAIYGEFDSNGFFTAKGIEAKFINSCQAIGVNWSSNVDQRTGGGAAYGLTDSTIYAENCRAVYGGAVAECDRSTVIAKGCMAELAGGAASRCDQLRLTAINCTAGQKGGGAYYCSDLSAEGFWIDNNSMEGPHIYASNNLTGPDEERHYWKGDYIGRRVNLDTGTVWRTDNE